MTRILFAGATAFALLTGCMHAAPAPAPMAAAPAPGHGGDMMAMCPMGVPGTKVSAVDEVNGSTLTFTAPGQVAELRRRVHAMVTMHNQHHAGTDAGAGMMHGGMKHETTAGHDEGMKGDDHEMAGMMMPPSHATVFELDDGASVKVMPSDPADLQKLQRAVRQHARQMQEKGCGMMGAPHAG